jgi:hypothetical protein
MGNLTMVKKGCDFCGGKFCYNRNIKLAIDGYIIEYFFVFPIRKKPNFRLLGEYCYNKIVLEGF